MIRWPDGGFRSRVIKYLQHWEQNRARQGKLPHFSSHLQTLSSCYAASDADIIFQSISIRKIKIFCLCNSWVASEARADCCQPSELRPGQREREREIAERAELRNHLWRSGSAHVLTKSHLYQENIHHQKRVTTMFSQLCPYIIFCLTFPIILIN